MRTIITPGKLYARLSAEFRRLRAGQCGTCRMPMVVLTHRAAPGDCNWRVEELNPLCETCAPLVAGIVREAAAEYDIKDPVSVPFFPLPPASARDAGSHVLRR